MVAKKKTFTLKSDSNRRPVAEEVESALAELKKLSSKKTRDEYGPRYGIFTTQAFGVKMSGIQQVAKRLGKSHQLAAALWATGWYEARLLASFVDEPDKVTPKQMDQWCRDFDNWGVCDTVCFKLFDQTPHAFKKVDQWAKSKDEFVKRGAFALLASLGVHDKSAADEIFASRLPVIERAAFDNRNFVKKGVSWALRVVGRRNLALNKAAVEVAYRLSNQTDAGARWVGRDAYKELTKSTIIKQLEARAAGKKGKTKP